MRVRLLASGLLPALACLALAAAPGSTLSAADPAPPAPVRGVWVHPGFFGTERTAALEKMRTTLDAYAEAGINTVIVLVKTTSGHVYYASEIGVPDPAWNWDFFGAFLAEARTRKMNVHAWFCVFPESSLLGEVGKHPDWLITSPSREMVRVVNPALPAVRAYEISLMLELSRKYAVDWIHLDYARYPCEPTEPYFSHDGETLRLFQQDTGIDMAAVKSRDTGNVAWNEWLRWNTGRVTLFVRELKQALKAAGSNARISAAVFPDAVNARVLIGQDWPAWAEEGLVDMLCPMLYSNSAGLFEKLVREAVAHAKGKSQVCAGIGIGTSHNQNTVEGMVEQMRISGSSGAAGVVFFSSSSLTAPFLERLKSIVTFKQDGEKLTGHYSSSVLGEAELAGTIKGAAIEFTVAASVQGNAVSVTFAGTVDDANSMKGKVSFAGLGEGTFTGKRK